jgi:hypothetical protein
MIDLDHLGEGVEYSFHDLNNLESLGRENDRLRRLLYATARKYNQTWRELENFKEFQGYYEKPLPFLRFPR